MFLPNIETGPPPRRESNLAETESRRGNAEVDEVRSRRKKSRRRRTEDEYEENEQPLTKYCQECGEQIRARAEICPKCGVRQPGRHFGQDGSDNPSVRQASGNRLAAGLCGIFLGGLGVHKFILGFTTPGIVMLLITVLSCGLGGIVTAIIGIVEGVIYISKSDEDFYQTYVIEKKAWF
jgi:TM2 domain-containing membrane protein YozV